MTSKMAGADSSAIDYYCDDVVGWHVVKIGDRWAAFEPLRDRARKFIGGVRKDSACSLTIRWNWARGTSPMRGSPR